MRHICGKEFAGSVRACVRRNSSSGHAWEGARRVLPHLLVRTDPRFRCRVHKLPAFLPYLPRRALVTIGPRLLVSVSSPGRPSPHLCERHERRVERRANSHVNFFFSMSHGHVGPPYMVFHITLACGPHLQKNHFSNHQRSLFVWVFEDRGCIILGFVIEECDLIKSKG